MHPTGSVSEAAADHLGHFALMYRGESGFLAEAVPFIRAGVRAGEPVMVAVAPDRIETLRQALGEDAGAVRFANMRVMGANPARIIPAWAEFLEEASPDGRPVRGIGEPIWAARTADEMAECERHEALLNLVLAQHPQMQLMCPYDLSSLDRSRLEAGFRTHPQIYERGRRRASDLYTGLAEIAGPFDAALSEPAGVVHEIHFTHGQVAEAREFVAHRAAAANLPTLRRADAEWAVAELVGNSIRHGGGSGTLQVWEEAEGLVCEVGDQGRVLSPLVGRERPSLSDAPGRGLWLVNQLCELVQIRSSDRGTVVRVHIHRAEREREIREVRLVADQLLSVWDRFGGRVEARLGQKERSLLWKLSPGAEAVLMSLPDRGLTGSELGALAARADQQADAVRAELESAGLIEGATTAAGSHARVVPTARARSLRDGVATARASVLQEMFSGLSTADLAVVVLALNQWQRN
jgi:anti-sigma regulatory factor (Ser/Thr protein kinase)